MLHAQAPTTYRHCLVQQQEDSFLFNCKKTLYNALLGTYDPIFELLTSKSAETNVVYTEKSLKSEYGGDYKFTLKCTLLLNFIRQLDHTDASDNTSMLRSGLLALMHIGAKLNVLDSDDLDAMNYAVLSNNTALTTFLIKNR